MIKMSKGKNIHLIRNMNKISKESFFVFDSNAKVVIQNLFFREEVQVHSRLTRFKIQTETIVIVK